MDIDAFVAAHQGAWWRLHELTDRARTLRQVKWWFLAGAFALPLLLMALGLSAGSAALLVLAFAVQYAGLLAERWYFFAQANHPQNLYYQTVS